MSKFVENIYAKVPSSNCKGLCHEACGPALVLPAEASHMRDKGVEIPTWDPDTLVCNHLDGDHRCSIYEDRPLICRLFGSTKKLKCPHGCEPDEGLMSERKSLKLITLLKKAREDEG